MPTYVLDTSAVLTFLERRPGWKVVESLLGSAGSITTRLDEVHEVGSADVVLLPFVTLMEVAYLTLRGAGEEASLRLERAILAWPVTLVESFPTWRRIAARVKARGGLSLADSWNAGLALLNEAELVHRDPELDQVEGLRSVRLP